ncbi:MAG: hypothetical protein J0L66_09805 [Cytophagales bacterium]|nr:hypothetical protein [Cytophagales bacterium]
MALLFPRPFAFAVDDLGWNEGSDLSITPHGGPHRAGVKRNFDLQDYQAMVAVGKAAGVRIQCLFILSEMDRANVLAKYPTTTHQREKWNNTHRVNSHQLAIMEYVKAQAAFIEFGLHGTGHEYWAAGLPQRRAEWYNLIDKHPWPEDELQGHILAFKEILAQYGLSPAEGHSFPQSFVPCAYSYYWNPTGAYSLGKLLAEAGVKYANTDFSQIPELNPPPEVNGGDFDFGVHVINRINYGNPWYQLDSLPTTPLPEQQTDVIESHWPNWLAQDDFLQEAVTAKWVAYYNQVQQLTDRYVAKNTRQLHSQWLYKKFTHLQELSAGRVEIDNRAMPDQSYQRDLLGNLVVKLRIQPGQFVHAFLNGNAIPAYFYQQPWCFLYLNTLQAEVYQLTYSIESTPPAVFVQHDGTGNIYKLESKPGCIMVDVEVYGSQVVKIYCPRPVSVTAAGPLILKKFNYASHNSLLEVEIAAPDIQGSRGLVQIATE